MGKRPSEQINAWIWLAGQYLSLHHADYANEAFANVRALCEAPKQRIYAESYILLLRFAKALLSDRHHAQIRFMLRHIRPSK